ncbi:hypothetical protein UNSW1_1727 [Campylobacter concisus UNSW1]|uniref:Uncharacterized protein n=1 Tax=Campylobacter concisus UNSWCS TaxID=1242968 RepID=U2F2H7_9BACT|nr:hypothetical protein UNSW1_1727 [Campylobacter concisus UNSW1]ERJ30696.1 hypothetical protein UNSWCS_1188 [Campylobacter concisus UNSWCS]
MKSKFNSSFLPLKLNLQPNLLQHIQKVKTHFEVGTLLAY